MTKLLNFWVTSLFKHEKKEFTALEGVFSVFFATMIVCLTTYAIGFIRTMAFGAMDLVFNAIAYPLIALIAAGLFVVMVRIASSIYGGKGTLGEEWCAIAPAIGSIIFVFGFFCIIGMNLFGQLWGIMMGTAGSATAGTVAGATTYLALLGQASTILLLVGAFISIFALVAAYLYGAVQGYWLENLKAVEGVELNKLMKIIWLGNGLLAFVMVVILAVLGGIWINAQLSDIVSSMMSTA